MDVSLLQSFVKRLVHLEEKLEGISSASAQLMKQPPIERATVPATPVQPSVTEVNVSKMISSEVVSLKQSMMRAINIKIEALVNEKINEVTNNIDSIKKEIEELSKTQQPKEEVVVHVGTATTAEQVEVEEAKPPPTKQVRTKKKIQGYSVDI